MKEYWQNNAVTIYHGDCREIDLQDISAIVTDPPYELGFMGKSWDSKGISFQKETWETLRKFCKSGSPILSFGGSRTFHRIAVAIEDAGWELRDTIMWVYGSGFPKSYDIAKGIEGNLTQGSASWNKWRNLDGEKEPMSWGLSKGQAEQGYRPTDYSDANKERVGKVNFHTPEAKLWEGYGTALKPAFEPIILGMNPLDGTFANNALKHGVAGLNIDECRVPTDDTLIHGGKLGVNAGDERTGKALGMFQEGTDNTFVQNPQGRFPANFIHDGSQIVMELFPDTNSKRSMRGIGFNSSNVFGDGNPEFDTERGYNDNGSAARFFMKCEPTLIDLCSAPKHDTMNICKNIYVATAEKLLTIIRAIIENTAHLNAEGLPDEQGDLLVKSAVNHADICEILTALVLVEIRTWVSNAEILQAIRDYTGNSKECTLLLNLALSVVEKGDIDITQITIDLLKSFGSANLAITNYIHEIEKTATKRFIYTPKASKSERNKGCEGLELKQVAYGNQQTAELKRGVELTPNAGVGQSGVISPQHNNHPTVKPLSLMEYLCKLVRYPEYNLILDPFMGSGTTLLACIRLGIPCIGIDNDEKSCEIAVKRCEYFLKERE